HHFDDVHARPTGRRDGKARRALGGYRRNPAGEVVVVNHIPGIVERAITDAFDIDFDRRARRTALWRNLNGHVEVEGHLGEKPRPLLQHDLVQEAVVLRRDEAHHEPSRGVGFGPGNLVGDWREI